EVVLSRSAAGWQPAVQKRLQLVMRSHNIYRILFLLALPLIFSSQGSASTIQGKVVEILDGERLSLTSVNQSFKVKLIAVAAPAPRQPFADVAKQHLSDLVVGKYVVVHFSGMTREGFVLGRVVARDMDVGEQMIRDGVAWYNKVEATGFTEIQKQEYFGSEQAARSEARGLWKDPNPVSPWDFRWREAADANPISKPQTLLAKSAGVRKPMSSDDLFTSMTGTNRLPGAGFGEADGDWKIFTPSPGKFSVYIPQNSQEFVSFIPTASGKTAEMNYSMGKRSGRVYLVLWGKGPNDGLTDDQVADEGANGLGYGLQKGAYGTGSGFSVDVKRQRSVRLGPYTGWQYKISGLGLPGTVRIFSKKVGEYREVYLLAAINGSEDDPQVKEFLGSFTIEKF